ncbi:glycosyltransferase [Gluconacetobacter johannae DSM 13595]|uniref:Glycosyltransferase family 2 protein n=1 Tax=Gluconacetobacter johannae TaxID=112140 RepID=A0A7W4J7I2_9PROT|nr:glycosyltransferase family 2 protein [Gluconacetobacter johannae]MBB2176031.1 glycosyltransferase family 2 protein [Gluconacetobacter johannae]GBQ79826.1 glycosyltransferase [Gluconacetobacter johannae DSM 13595]
MDALRFIDDLAPAGSLSGAEAAGDHAALAPRRPAGAARALPVTIVLSVYNGAAFLPAQLRSILAQTCTNWTILWRDDGSSDGSAGIMRAFQHGAGAGRCVEIDASGRHLGIAPSYLRLLRAAPRGSVIAFADQDDVWLPDKIRRGLDHLGRLPADRPALYCGRQILVDRDLRTIGLSPGHAATPCFLAALTQNAATGCTIMFNDAARAVIEACAPPPPPVLHDWWAYLLVLGAGGVAHVDPCPMVLYRQHPDNAVGAPGLPAVRALRALRRGPRAFMNVFRQTVGQLLAQDDVLTDSARRDLAHIGRALRGGHRDRLRLLGAMPAMARHGAVENLVFRLWLFVG